MNGKVLAGNWGIALGSKVNSTRLEYEVFPKNYLILIIYLFTYLLIYLLEGQ